MKDAFAAEPHDVRHFRLFGGAIGAVVALC